MSKLIIFPGFLGSRAAFFLLLMGLGCVINPLTRRPQLITMSEREESALGQRAFLELSDDQAMVREGPTAAWVQSLGGELAALAPGPVFDYQFHILDSAEPNAYALPGGQVMVSRGLLLLFTDTDELAGVLSHEIGHVAARHAAARLVWSVPAKTVGTWLGRAVGLFDAEAGQALADALPRTVLAPYARDQEREADRIGVALAASAGYDAAALARVLARLEASRGAASDFSLTHPATPERLELIQILAAQLQRGERAPGADSLAALDGLVVGDDAGQGVVIERRLVVAEHHLSVALPDGWVIDGRQGQIVAVAPGGVAVLRLRVIDQAQARRRQESLRLEPGLAGFEKTAGPQGEVTTATLHHAGQPPAMSHFAYLVHAGAVLEVWAQWAMNDEARLTPVLNGVLSSLRDATPQELDEVEVVRLRFVAARDGETLPELVSRTFSAWSPGEVALYNGVPGEKTLAAGQLLKIARRERWHVDSRNISSPPADK